MESQFKGFIQRIEEVAGQFPEKNGITVDNCSLSYSGLVEGSGRVAHILAAEGIVPGDKVGIILPNSVDWYTVYWGIVRAGGIPVPLNPQIGKWELKQLLESVDMKLCFSCPRFRSIRHLENFREIVKEYEGLKKVLIISPEEDDINEEKISSLKEEAISGSPAGAFAEVQDTLMLACTSGSTGNPKIIAVSQNGFYQAEWDMAGYLDLGPEDVMLLGMPLFHLGGFGMGLQAVLKGGSVIYQSQFDAAAFLKEIQDKKATVIQLTSTLAKILLSVPDFDKYDISSLRLCYFAGEVLPQEVASRFYKDLGIRVVNIIGSTETATMLVWDSEEDREVDCNIYRTLDFTDVKLCDDEDQEVGVNVVGMIHIFTDGILKEYYNNPAETAAKIYSAGGKRWFRTGDLGEKLSDGRIRFIGRKKRVIKRGGNLVFPEQIEAYLLTHEDVEAVAVTVEKHELMGEMIIAHVQVQKEITPGKLIQFCRGNLSSYKIPDEFRITTELPKDIGKIQYKSLREKL